MSIVDQVEGAAKKWLLGIGLKKGITSLVKVVFSYCVAHAIKVSVVVPGIGVLDTNSELALTAFINSGVTVLRNWLKTKYPEKFGWL